MKPSIERLVEEVRAMLRDLESRLKNERSELGHRVVFAVGRRGEVPAPTEEDRALQKVLGVTGWVTGSQGGGMTTVYVDGRTIGGDGSIGSPLSASLLSGTFEAALINLSGTLNAAIQSITTGAGFLTGVAHDATLSGNGTGGSPLSASPLSGTINARFLNLTGSLVSGLSSTYSSLQAGSTASLGSLYTVVLAGTTASIASLSGTVDARFKNWNYSSIGVTGTLTATGDLEVSGSITGSGDVLLRRDLLVNRNLVVDESTRVVGSLTGGLDASFVRDVTIGRFLSIVGGANAGAVVASNGWSNQTANTITVSALSNGTYDTSAGNLSTIGIQANVFASRSLGTGTLNQIAVVGTVSGSTSVATSVGLLGQGEGGTSASYGVYGTAFRSQGINYGGYFTNENPYGLPDQGANYALFATGTTKLVGDVYITGNLFAANLPSFGGFYSSLQAGVTQSINGIYSTILAGTSASDAAVQVSLKAGATASLQTYYSTILLGTSASDAAVQTSLKAGTTASLQQYYTTILAGVTASDAAVQNSLKAGVTASIGSIYSTILAGTSASDASLLELNYPTSAGALQSAIGFGEWASGTTAGWLFEESTGSLLPVYGTITLAPVGSEMRYGFPGPRGAADRSVFCTGSSRFGAGTSDFNAGTANDVAFALVVMSTGTVSGGGSFNIPIIKQLLTSVGPGWQLSVPPGTSNTINFTVSGSAGAGGVAAPTSLSGRPDAPFVVLGAFSRLTGKTRVAVQSLTTGQQVVSSLNTIADSGANLDNSQQFTFAHGTANGGFSYSALFLCVGSGSANGLPENLAQATANFALAVNRVQGTAYSTVTGSIATLSGTIDARFKGISSVLGNLLVPGSITGSGDATFSRNVGVGTAAPNSNLHVVRSATSAISPVAATVANFDSNGAVRVTLASPQEKAFYFASTASNVDGAILYDQANALRGLQVRTGGNVTQLTLDSLGFLHVHKDMGVTGSLTGSGDAWLKRDLSLGRDLLGARSIGAIGATDIGGLSVSNGFGPHSGVLMVASIQSTGRHDTTSAVGGTYALFARAAASRSNGANDFSNIAVAGVASGSSVTKANVGILGQSEGGAITAYGVYGTAFGSTTNYGGYFTNENPYGTGNSGVSHALYATGTVKFIGDLYVSGTIIATNVTIPGGSIGGTGTANKIPKFTAPQTIGDSNITDSGAGVSVTGPLTASLDLLVSRNELVSGDSRTVGSLTGSGDAVMSRRLTVEGDLGIGGAITGTVGKLVETATGRAVAQPTLIIFTTGTYDVTGPIVHRALAVNSSAGKSAGASVYLNTAIEGNASNSPFLNVGVSGQATGSATQNNGIYGNATGATTNWAGYFDGGNVHIENNLEVIGTITGANFMSSGSIDGQRVSDGLDHLSSSRYFDDFITDKLSITSNVGAGTVAWQPYEPGHPGIVRATTSTSGTSVVDIYLSDVANGGVTRYGGGPLMFESCLRIPTVDNGTNNAHRRTGIWVQTSLDTPSDGAWFEVNRTRYGDNEFRLRTAATSSQNQMRTGVTAASGRWYRLRLDWASDGDAVTGSIFCSGNLISTIATRTYLSNAGAQSPGFFQTKTLGASAVTTDLDYMMTQVTFTGSRT